MGIASSGAGPSHGGGGSCGGSDGGQPPLGESGGLYADGGGKWPSPRTAQHRVSASLGMGVGERDFLIRSTIEKLLVGEGCRRDSGPPRTSPLPTSAFIHLA